MNMKRFFSLRRFTMISLILTFNLQLLFSQYPIPALPADTTQFGKKISRTLSLLGTSTPTNKKKVKVLVYGQSISEQDWWNQVKTWLQTTYPNADLEMINRAVGAFSSDMLWRICEMDVANFYPDLVIFHVYGNHYFYETLMRMIRGRTAAEILVQTDFINGTQNSLSLSDMSDWSNHMSFEVIPGYAATYGMEVIDTRTQWKNYLVANSLNSTQLDTTDETHLNVWGNFLQAKLTEQHLVYKGKFPADPDNLCKTYNVGSDVVVSAGKITLTFTGNKIELIPNAKKAVKLYIKIDGKKPSEFPTCYNITRPCLSGSFWNGGFSARPSISKPVSQSWTLEFTAKTAFKVTGSKTGLDGTGDATTRFASNSGQVVIQPKDWWTPLSWEPGTAWKFSTGSKVNWTSFGMFSDTIDFNTITLTANYENPINAVQGLPNGTHTLEITSSTGEFPISAVKVYKPAFNLTLTTSVDTIKAVTAGGTTAVTVNTNTFWQSFDTTSWISCNAVDNFSATDNLKLFDQTTLNVTVNQNTGANSRTTKLLLSGIGVQKTIVIVQNGTGSPTYTLLKDSELANKTYGNAAFTLTNDATGKTVVYSSANTAIASISGSTVTIKGAGTVNISAQIQGDAASKVTKPLTVSKKSLSVSTPNIFKTEGTANPAFILTYSGFVNGDDESDLDTKPTATCTATVSSKPGPYNIIIAGGSDNNYTFVFVNSSKLTVSATALDNEATEISLYPNPARETVTLAGTNGLVTVMICTTSGETLKTLLVENGVISIDGLPAGLYLVKIIKGSETVIKKLIIE